MGIILLAFLVAFAFIVWALVRVHTNPDSRLSKEDESQIGEIELRRPRGDIRDRHGELLAKDRKVYSLWANPSDVDHPDMAAVCLAELLDVDETVLRSRLMDETGARSKRKFVWIGRWLTQSDLDAYEKLDPMLEPGLALKKEPLRFYPEGELAAHVLGFVNKEGYGCAGIELAYDRYLRCVPGKRRARVDLRRRVLESFTLEYVPQEGAEHVHLTLDKALQRAIENRLDQALDTCDAPAGMGIVMDPHTGAILALACRPAFDPNEFGKVPPEEYKNRAVVDVFEPGSSFKIVTYAAALEHGLIAPDMLIDCENGAFNPYGHVIRDFHRLGVVTVRQAYTESSNIAAIKIAAMLGDERLEAWVQRFGFGRRTSGDLPGESPGLVHPRDDWSKLTMGAIPIGQEIAVTMPQLARAFCAIANGGWLVSPYLVERVVDREGVVTYQHQGGAPERILSEATAATMRELCHEVCLHGTGKPASIPEFRTGGKTGTAQIARPDGKGFYPDKYTTIFAGFAPLANPRLCAAIVVQRPAIRLHYGGYVCGPVFKDVVREALIRMDCRLDPVPGADTQEEPETPPTGDADTMAVRAASDLAPVKLEDPETLLAGMEMETLGLDDLALVSSKAPVAPQEDGPVLADLAGMTKRQAKAYVDVLRIRWDTQGVGRVVAQHPPPGTPLRDVTSCQLVFSNQPPKEEYEPSGDSQAARL